MFYCAKCGEALTDAASIEVGIGPICRKLSNESLAHVIPANVQKAVALLCTVKVEHESTVDTFALIADKITGVANGTELCNDWRETVKRLAWVISRGASHGLKVNLCGVMAALGYVSYANVMMQVAVASEATAVVEGSRVYLTSKKPSAAAREAIKTIAGRQFHAMTDTTPARWSFPVTQLGAFWNVFVAYFPNHKTTLVELMAAAAPALAAAKSTQAVAVPAPAEVTLEAFLAGETKPAAVEAPSGKPAPSVYMYVTKAGLKVETPYNASFVDAIKSLPWNGRKWNGAEKCWIVSTGYKTEVESMIQKHYGVSPTVVEIAL